MRNYIPAVAILIALGLTAFKHLPSMVNLKGNKFTNCCYSYVGAQTVAARKNCNNYVLTACSELANNCPGGPNECGVEIFSNGTCPTHPDCFMLTFDANGLPNGGSSFVQNFTKP